VRGRLRWLVLENTSNESGAASDLAVNGVRRSGVGEAALRDTIHINREADGVLERMTVAKNEPAAARRCGFSSGDLR
jgi:hypothetical protein